jgi:outer membrane usher protein FimD/PapC
VGQKGMVYLTHLLKKNHLTVRWQGQECQATVSYKSANQTLAHLGKITCTE